MIRGRGGLGGIWIVATVLLLAGAACSDVESTNPVETTTSASSTSATGGSGGTPSSSSSSSSLLGGSGGGGTSDVGGLGGLGGSGGDQTGGDISNGGAGGQAGAGGASSASSGVGGASSSSAGGASASSSSSGSGGGAPVHVRIATANTTTGNDQSYDPGQGIRIFEGLHPDIALVQEFNYGDDSPAAIRSMVDQAFGATFQYQRETTVGLPNGIVSRYPIVGRGTFVDPDVTNRSFVWARIDVPGPHDLWAVSVHLLTTSAASRGAEATALLGDLEALVPAGDYLVIGGDFNTKARDEACITTLAAIVDIAAPYPVDNIGNDNTNGPRSHAYDWLMPNRDLRALETPVVIGAATFANGLVLDSRVYAPLADVAPVLFADSDPSAPNNMQHMAVVKDFVLAP